MLSNVRQYYTMQYICQIGGRFSYKLLDLWVSKNGFFMQNEDYRAGKVGFGSEGFV
jgi:hypothetical protein